MPYFTDTKGTLMAQAKNQPSIDSPCVRNCCLDGQDICMGCGRHLNEILQWQRVSDSEREAILIRASARRMKLTPNGR
jgi:predicted Fe-S protein YdhL (DUF1289 family)